MAQLPEDIIQYILEFNPEHREKFKLTFDELESKAAVMKHSILTNDWNAMSDEERTSFTTFIVFSSHIDDLQKYVKALHKCKCCARHQINKPRHYYDMEWDIDPSDFILAAQQIQSHRNCSCPCRHMARACCVASLLAHRPQVIYDYYTD